MAYFEPYIDAEGVHIPTYDDILEYLISNYKTIFGDDVYLGVETPDYQMLSVIAKSMEDFSALATQAYYERDPQYASGDALDLIVQMSGLTRRLPTASSVVLTLSGVEGTVVEAGKQAIDDTGNLWTIQSDVTIPSGGEVTANAVCETLGAIASPIGAVHGIYTPVPGWEGVTNEAEGTIGVSLESDAELRVRFEASHAITQSGVMSSFVTGLYNIAGVKFVDVVENDTGSTDSKGLPAHSICAVVDGGDADEIARKILGLKSPGVATYGGVTKTVVDSDGNSYTIKFSRPTVTTVSIVVTVLDLGGYDASRINTIIKEALKADINNLGIGKSWNITMGYKDIYSYFDSKDMPFAITGLTSSDADENGVVECAYDHVLSADDAHITINVAT